LEIYRDRWQLSDISFLPASTVNLLFTCKSDRYGSCILKLCIPGPEVATEIGCLRAYDGSGYCKLWDFDRADNILLLERVFPGDNLWAIGDFRKRALLFGETLRDFPFHGDGAGHFPTYLTWMESTQQKITRIGGLEEMIPYLVRAHDTYLELKQRQSRACLLHGDLHQGNLLLNSSDGYTIIDPKGVIDDPVMETARFLLNEIDRDGLDELRIKEIATILSPLVNSSVEDILSALFIDTVLSKSWSMEEYYSSADAFTQAKHDATKTCSFVYDLL